MNNICEHCIGSGYIQQKEELCSYCEGKKCIYCKSTGYRKQSYTTCYYCFGSGEKKIDEINCMIIDSENL